MPQNIDPQCQSVYGADRAFRKEFPERLSEDGVRNYAHQITATRWWKDHKTDDVEPSFLFLGDVREDAISNWNTAEIILPDWAMCRLVVAHEMAHQLVGQYDRRGFRLQSHGPVFAEAFLAIVQATMTTGKWAMLAHEFTLRGVCARADEEKPMADQEEHQKHVLTMSLRRRHPILGVQCGRHAYTRETVEIANFNVRDMVRSEITERWERAVDAHYGLRRKERLQHERALDACRLPRNLRPEEVEKFDPGYLWRQFTGHA